MTNRNKLTWPTAQRDRELARLVFDSKTLAALGIDASELAGGSFAGQPADPDAEEDGLAPITLPDGTTYRVDPTVARLVEALRQQLHAAGMESSEMGVPQKTGDAQERAIVASVDRALGLAPKHDGELDDIHASAEALHRKRGGG